MTPSLGIVVPAFHPDTERLARFVRALDETLSPAVIRIELDDADAATREVLAELPAELNAIPYRRGKGAAITAGFEALDTDRLAFADADGATPADSVADVVAALDGADLAVGSRRHPDATVLGHQTFARRYLGDGFAWLARRLLDVDLYDYQCGAKALTRDAWGRVREHLYEPGFAWDVELVAMAGALGLRVAEVPVTWEDAPGSTVSPVSTAVSLARALLAARHRAKRLKRSRVHDALAATREEPTALVHRK
ncbi:glycosyltransferase [Natronomonas sp. EA1]|uniref:glycosyltransferase n=1 Tax=Natronomonas sp. EA1 TaxID=3421655 RepID=UPI003EB6E653